MAVKATFQIDLGIKNDLSGSASIELDARDDGLNGGRKEFRGGDTIYYLLHTPPNTIIVDIIVSEGDADEHGTARLDVSEILVFDYPDELSQKLSKTPEQKPSTRWIGSGLALSPTFDESTGSIVLPQPNPLVKRPQRKIGVLKCQYNELAKVIRLRTPKTVDDSPFFTIHGVVAGYISQ